MAAVKEVHAKVSDVEADVSEVKPKVSDVEAQVKGVKVEVSDNHYLYYVRYLHKLHADPKRARGAQFCTTYTTSFGICRPWRAPGAENGAGVPSPALRPLPAPQYRFKNQSLVMMTKRRCVRRIIQGRRDLAH